MQTFQAVCAKNGQKVELIVKYHSLEEARDGLHNQGYSIIDIRVIDDASVQWKAFHFEITIDGKKKSGQIQSVDIFKAYIKLVDDLHYDVVSIYENQDASEEEKMLTTSKIRASYAVYRGQQPSRDIKQERKEPIVEHKTESKEKQTENISETYVGKELLHYYDLIEKILQKIENIINVSGNSFSDEKKSKLQGLYVVIKQLKNTTNIDKLRIVSEEALLKIGSLELELVKGNIELQKQNFVSETNQLLKKFWSTQKIRDPETDAYFKIKRIALEFYENFKERTEKRGSVQKVDTQSFVYYKNIRELNIYKQKLNETNRELLMATISFRRDKYERLNLKKKLILQNIQLVKKRIDKENFSYTKIVKWSQYYIDIILLIVRFLGTISLYIVFLFSLFYSISPFMSDMLSLNYSAIYPIVLLSFFAFLTKLMKSFSLLSLLGLVYILFILFIQINF